MAAWRRAIELSLGDEDTAELNSIAQSRTEPASRNGGLEVSSSSSATDSGATVFGIGGVVVGSGGIAPPSVVPPDSTDLPATQKTVNGSMGCNDAVG